MIQQTTMKLLHRILPVFLYLFCQSQSLKYEGGQSYRYTYQTSVIFNQFSKATETPMKQKDVGLQVAGEFDVELLMEADGIQLFKLQVAHAQVNSVLKPEMDYKLATLSSYPILFEILGGQIEKLYTAEKDKIFDVNFKKGIISLFQVDTSQGSREEVDVSGECMAYYLVSGSQVIKSKNDCKNLEIAGQFTQANKMLGVTVNRAANSVYEISDDVIQSVRSQTRVTAQVNLRSDLNSSIFERQMIKLKDFSSTSGPFKVESIEDAVAKVGSDTGTNFEMNMLPSIQEVQHCMENCVSPASLLTKYKDILTKENMATKESAKAFLDTVRSFRNAGKSIIEEVFTSPDSYYIVSQLIDIGVATQTEAAHQSLMDLLNFDDEYYVDYPERYLLATAFTSHPAEYILQNLLDLLKKKVPNVQLRESVTLSLGAVIHTFCRDPEKCKSEVVADYRKTVMSELEECGEDEGCMLMYLRSLGNAGLPPTVNTLLVHAENAKTAAVSIAAIQALRRMLSLDVGLQVKEVMGRIVHQLRRCYDTTVRSHALEVFLQLQPTSQEIRDIIATTFTPPVSEAEYSTYVLAVLRDKLYPELRATIQKVLSEVKISNYNTLAQKGLSSAVSGYFAVTRDVNSTYGLYMENSKSGLMKSSSMLVNVMGKKATVPLLNFGLYADGLEALLGEEESPQEEEDGAGVDSTAGMSLQLMNVLLRPIEFFRGSAGLMSAVWSAPSDPVSALQINLLLQDHSERIHLSNGLVVDLQVIGAASIDLSGSVSISLWNRNANSKVINSGALVVEGSLRLDSTELMAGMDFTAEGESKIDFTTDVDFYEMPFKMCLQMSRPSVPFRNWDVDAVSYCQMVLS